ncbi:MAG: PhzF family phenazine biosynthesis protein [Pseudomonadota bacterium]
MEVQRFAAFSQGDEGGNPAGVVLLREAATEAAMAQVAAQVGYSETAFAFPQDASGKQWRVRYFSPESEVPFCGHATIALGAVLGQRGGAGTYTLTLNDATVTVDAEGGHDRMIATLTSPPTRSREVAAEELQAALSLFSLTASDLDPRLAPARIHGGADHLVLPLKSRTTVAGMHYSLAEGRELMRRHGWVTVMLVFIEHDQTFIARNAFASGGVLEDPATGAAAAAFAGYLRDQAWPHGGAFKIRQGEDMGSPSLIEVALGDTPGSGVSVSGEVRMIATG